MGLAVVMGPPVAGEDCGSGNRRGPEWRVAAWPVLGAACRWRLECSRRDLGEVVEAPGQVLGLEDHLVGPAAQLLGQLRGARHRRDPVPDGPGPRGAGLVVGDALALDDDIEAVAEPGDEVRLVEAPRSVEVVGQ